MSDPIIGEIRLFPYSFVPVGWLFCDGTIHNIQGYQALFSILANRYGGDGKTTFAVPDLRSRVIVGAGKDYTITETGGQESVTLNLNTTPPHTHTVNGATIAVRSEVGTPTNNYLSNALLIKPAKGTENCKSYSDTPPDTTMNPATLSPFNGKSGAHENRQPFLAMQYCICWDGVYPTRP